MTSCPNCGQSVESWFCPDCGQSSGDLLPTVREWARELLDDLFLVNRKLPRDIRTLVARPGQLSQDWAQGRRAQHVQPFRLFLLIALGYVLLTPLAYQGGGGGA